MAADPKPVPVLGDDRDDGPNIDSGVTAYHGAREADAATNASPGTFSKGPSTMGTQTDGTRKGVAGTEQPSFPTRTDEY